MNSNNSGPAQVETERRGQAVYAYLLQARDGHDSNQTRERMASRGLDGEVLDEAVQTARRVAELASEGDRRGATDLAAHAAQHLAAQVRSEAAQLSREQVADRVRGGRTGRAARAAAAASAAAPVVPATRPTPRRTLPRK
ncbi:MULTISPECIES: hypothetical protein [Nocardiopsis]|uniref:Uncharacterized protein n=1 Tax=Nocardiopsis sinuspersici TaxID=501010 RepID=A0A1V3BW75_9ACTN|nr:MULTISPECIES: hypothetical protein [Nocardiopsis]OOC52622.1 hypothetical protein NOSIN_01240 [Nocardiopsis sinuspersici]